jgi:3'-phosphoadenosine 5'-phosphosulfate (PAPS) 3'-phosphatase
VLNAAGGRVTDCNGKVLRYNKKSILNPWFMALGDSDCDWYGLAAGLVDED